MKFGDRLARLRKEKDLTQDQLGVDLGVDHKNSSKSVVVGWEKNRHFPRADQLATLCERHGWSADYLLLGTVSESSLQPEVLAVAGAINELSPPRRAKFLASVKQFIEDAREADTQEAERANRKEVTTPKKSSSSKLMTG